MHNASLIHEAQEIQLDSRSKSLRRKMIDSFVAAKRGHLASAFSLAEILRVFYDDILKFDVHNPKAQDRDRFVLSKGHGCLALYVLLQEKGFFPESELYNFCTATGILGGHPEYGKIPGVEASTGSLGHGLPIGLGMALRAKMDRLPYRTFVVMGDGECGEGSVWEAAISASKHRLSALTVIIDANRLMTYGSTDDVEIAAPLIDRWKSFGFQTLSLNGHDTQGLKRVLSTCPLDSGKPTALICHTIKGKGVPFTEGNLSWHHKTKLTPEEIQSLYDGLRDET